MPPRTNAIQQLVSLINASLADSANIQQSAMLPDRITGLSREVDVLISKSVAGYDINIAIEVVDHGRPADVTWVEQMVEKHNSLTTNKLILVSSAGFSEGARIKAEFFGIETISLKDAMTTDWSFIGNLSNAGYFEVVEFRYSCSVLCLDENGDSSELEVPLSTPIIVNGQEILLDDFIGMILQRPEVRQTMYPEIAVRNKRQFIIEYEQSPELFKYTYEGQTYRVVRLRALLKASFDRRPVTCSSGSYKDLKFFAGKSASSPDELEFAFLKKPDGTIDFYLLRRSP